MARQEKSKKKRSRKRSNKSNNKSEKSEYDSEGNRYMLNMNYEIANEFGFNLGPKAEFINY